MSNLFSTIQGTRVRGSGILEALGVLGVLLAGVSPLAAWAATDVYRSVGNLNTAISTGSGANTLTISGSTATFSGVGLANKAGVGDVIVYNSNANIAFITARASATSYTVKAANGTSAPTAVTGDTAWTVYRAYLSLANLIGDGAGGSSALTENTGIPAGVRNFDVAAFQDLVTTNKVLHIACYNESTNDATQTAFTSESWVTGPSNYIRIYTPYLSSEVGTSQRHSGTWSTSAYRISSAAFGKGIRLDDATTNPMYVRIEGLQFENTDATAANKDSSIEIIMNTTSGQQAQNVWIYQNIFRNAKMPIRQQAMNDQGELRIFNNLIYDSYGAAIQLEANSKTYVYNNTVIGALTGGGVTGYGIRNDSFGVNFEIFINNLVQNSASADYISTTARLFDNASNSANIGNTGSAPGSSVGITVSGAQAVSFLNSAGKDFHLDTADTKAKGMGTNLSADANIPFTTDFEGTIRVSTAWDIGADAFVRAIPDTLAPQAPQNFRVE